MATAWTHDLIASDHPLYAGRPGTIGTRPGNFALQAADWVLVIGSRLNIRQSSYNWDAFAKNAFVVQVDIDSAELNKPGVPVDLRLQCDAKQFISALEQALQGQVVPNFSPWLAWVRELGQRFDVRHEHPQAPHAALNPYAVVDRIFKQLRPDDVVVCGNASACIIPFQIGRLGPNNRMFSNSGSASMGYDLPAALGAARAHHPGRVLCFAGDGSLQMNIQELQTLKTSQLPIIILVLNNAGYISISQTHENFFGRVIGANPASGVEFPDFCQVARAYGIEAATIASVADLDRLAELLQSNGPLLLNLIVDPKQNFEPRCKSRLDSNGQFSTPELDDMFPFLDPAALLDVRTTLAQIQSRPS
ncbi:MAG: Acetolactate synthase isozyme 2 large subunit [Dehalococcoidia bacterium]|nr:Acetolactate synthase isozyme 2 large subunit [Chloroflexota bacterium]